MPGMVIVAVVGSMHRIKVHEIAFPCPVQRRKKGQEMQALQQQWCSRN